MDDPVAVGFAYTVEASSPKDQSGQMQCWQERHTSWCASLALATSQEKALARTGRRAPSPRINALDEHQAGQDTLA